ncbi:tripartite motif-containing protein 10-like isoform X2 [Dermochelys coriacea]|uniref:tripartite motif-containing protein 10-like isoform X2 n=1 Tax=Dermochelys coriacea TaxID=27794 RepID=UPI001CAA0B20|nr:tripartite motif-containing protein 10-like isoform X2 [Dermochelys coriacea]XP_043352770.1 tripartite motif-containing protein 10-like isoform X2 [Dermochelys coriacea]
MASVIPVEEIQDEIQCPICLKYLTDPVSVQCGHNFCRVCITQYCETWAEADYGPVCCPNCRALIQRGTLRPNWQLANIVNKIKQMELKPGKEKLCETQNKTLDLLCEEDGETLCVACERSPEHGAHTMILMEEAAQKYKEKIQAHLETLREEREKLLGFKVTGEGKSRKYLIQTQTERQKIVSEFQQLQQFLQKQEQVLLATLENLEKEIVILHLHNVTKLSEKISCFSNQISELEGKHQKPASEFLQDFRSTLSRCKKGKSQQPVEISPELEKRLGDFSQKIIAVTEILRKFKVNVTLDPDTAHPVLVLSEDQKSVRWGDTRQDLPDNPKRFDTELCVLGCEGFTSGRHFWEVEVGNEGHWAVGVARECVRRKGGIRRNPEGGIWAVGQCGGQFKALTSMETPLPLSWVPKRIQVFLDYEQGQVTFFDVDKEAMIFTFPPASFTGERIYPWLWVWGSQLRIFQKYRENSYWEP